ncbi:protein VASCULATURE COMPLEXITY AND CONNECTIVITY-like isoform X2 [Raphanus sativus]|uniref:Protein VASCULATURE COMPLEXITY AND CONNECTIVITY-like isoform X2 n=1 Tax=Raphanus sativus TaxID=3726 RepID=A0A9W3DDK0_RAPSA|nr:protein VASCULATURE COMPLEXITY AND CONNECTIVITY-like isoform X2 [Raphanus sativus]
MATLGGVLVCLLIAALDVAAAILGIQAEVAQNQYTNLGLSDCREPSNDAFRRGLGAIAMLVIAQVLINLFGGCLCICSQEFQRSSSIKQISMVCLVSTWIVVVVAFLTLVIGTLTNSKSSSSCGLAHLHFLSVGGILCFLHALLCAAYYASATAAKDEAAKDEAAKPISA